MVLLNILSIFYHIFLLIDLVQIFDNLFGVGFEMVIKLRF